MKKEAQQMQLEMKKRDNILIVKVEGELDHHYSDEIRKKIDQELMLTGVKHAVFDFTNLTFMDSSGIGMLVGRYRVVRSMKGNSFVICKEGHVQKILEMSGIFRLIPRKNSVDDAINSITDK
jgi:stage II sporulation protein AA (anti-sigma F factor antagonist)